MKHASDQALSFERYKVVATDTGFPGGRGGERGVER
jgi:hypothetical protein